MSALSKYPCLRCGKQVTPFEPHVCQEQKVGPVPPPAPEEPR